MTVGGEFSVLRRVWQGTTYDEIFPPLARGRQCTTTHVPIYVKLNSSPAYACFFYASYTPDPLMGHAWWFEAKCI